MADKEIETAIAKLTDWTVVNGKLNRAFKFNNFVDAFAFMTKVAIVAEKADHHPEFLQIDNFNLYRLQIED
jgi:4a-hydroxytetrahydrobiopterin dehydratase